MNTSTIDPVALDAWAGFTTGQWADGIDVRDFIQRNYRPYEGDDRFLAGPTARTTAVWAQIAAMFPEERAKGIYDVDAHTPSTITSHAPGYIDKDKDLIVGLQTDAPLKRAIMPNGGYRMVLTSLASYGYDISGPATTGREAVQWLYFAYLAAVKEQNGAAMSLGRTSTFLDIYLQR